MKKFNKVFVGVLSVIAMLIVFKANAINMEAINNAAADFSMNSPSNTQEMVKNRLGARYVREMHSNLSMMKNHLTTIIAMDRGQNLSKIKSMTEQMRKINKKLDTIEGELVNEIGIHKFGSRLNSMLEKHTRILITNYGEIKKAQEEYAVQENNYKIRIRKIRDEIGKMEMLKTNGLGKRKLKVLNDHFVVSSITDKIILMSDVINLGIMGNYLSFNG